VVLTQFNNEIGEKSKYFLSMKMKRNMEINMGSRSKEKMSHRMKEECGRKYNCSEDR
jgi:hypothetical protein